MTNQPVTPKALTAGQNKPHPPHIPGHFPEFPDPHTYIKTPVSENNIFLLFEICLNFRSGVVLLLFIPNISPDLIHSFLVGCGHPLPSRNQPESLDFCLTFVLVEVQNPRSGVFLTVVLVLFIQIMFFLALNIPCLWVVDIPWDGILPITCSQSLPSSEFLALPLIHSLAHLITFSQTLPTSESFTLQNPWPIPLSIP